MCKKPFQKSFIFYIDLLFCVGYTVKKFQAGDTMKKSYVLPPVEDRGELELLHFPTRMQAFVFRNWETVSAAKLAEVLQTSEENVKALAFQMGLCEQGDVSVWKKKGYITIRNRKRLGIFQAFFISLFDIQGYRPLRIRARHRLPQVSRNE